MVFHLLTWLAPCKTLWVLPEHFNFQIAHTIKMLRRCVAKRGNARDVGVGELCSPLNNNLKAKML